MVSKRTLQGLLEIIGNELKISTTPVRASRNSKNIWKTDFLYLDQPNTRSYHPVIVNKETGGETDLGLGAGVSANDCYYFLRGYRYALEFKKRRRR